MESLLILNPAASSHFKLAAAAPLPARSRLSSSPRLRPLLGLRPANVSFLAKPLPRRSLTRRVLALAASHEDSHSESEAEKGKKDFDFDAEKVQELWKQALNTFREQAVKMKSISEDAYEEYSVKALAALNETSKTLKVQAEKAREDLVLVVQELGEEGQEYIAKVAESYPEEVKEIVGTFTSPTEDLREISKVQDFYFGIPYGLVLSVGGFLSFMVTGSIAAIRFGLILGGALLALSILSLRAYKRGQSFPLALKGQAAIASILFLRELRLVFQRPSIVNLFATLISATMVSLYIYRMVLGARHKKEKDISTETE